MPESRRPPLDDVAEAFLGVAHQLRREQMRAMEPFGLTPSEGRALRVLVRHAPMRPGDLAAHLRVVPRSVTDVVDTLERAGLVERTPDPADRRATLLSLTEAGEALNQELGTSRQKVARRFFERVSADDRASLRRILADLVEPEPRS